MLPTIHLEKFYATRFSGSADSATFALENWRRLLNETNAYSNALFSSTLPDEVLDAVSANISILKSPTVLRLEDGTFYGFEGCHPGSGCCEGSCTHVWNYAYALPFLFPGLERSMRNADYAYNISPDGGMRFRLQLPLGPDRSSFRPCADGQFGGIIKFFREWKLSGDTDWLKSHWDSIKRNLEYAWSEDNPDRWDRDRDGVLEGRQHHTLDMELFGPNSWLTGFYLAALAAAAEMADAVGEDETGTVYRELFLRGRRWVDENLFNGEYYFHKIDATDRSILQAYVGTEASGQTGLGEVDGYWSEEHGEVKYQIAEGCGIDQMVAQWHANLLGLPEIFDREKATVALTSIYRNNFRRARDVVNPCRVFAVNDEKALLICAFPAERPVIPVPYAEEAMNGFEYQAACHMIQAGPVSEGLDVVRAVRDRYDGKKRNPWNEFECGSNYARSMASYSLLLAYSGFEFDMVAGHIRFAPILESDRFHCLFSVGSAWGTVSIDGASVDLKVLGGRLTLNSFSCSVFEDNPPATVAVGTSEVAYDSDGRRLRFQSPVTIEPGGTMTMLR